jgi:hypothetical protein
MLLGSIAVSFIGEPQAVHCGPWFCISSIRCSLSSANQCSKPIGPGETRSSIIRVLQREWLAQKKSHGKPSNQRAAGICALRLTGFRGGAQQEEFARAAAGRINHYLHSPYGTGSALLSLFGVVPSAHPRALFCSQLVSRAYTDVNVAVVPGHEPEKITPEMLATSPLFENVTAIAAFATRAVPEYLVSGTFETLGGREVANVEKMYRELRPFFVERAIPPPRNWILMLSFLADVDNEETK